MPIFDLLLETLSQWLPVLLSSIGVFAALRLLDWWLLRRHLELGSEKRLPRQLFMLAMTLIGIITIVLSLPLDSSTREHLPAIIGVIASIIIGLSSTTLVANAMSSVMLRTAKSIRTGDYLRVEDHFGRVTERGLLHTEIQTESRELTTLPNLYLISKPFTVVRSSGTIVSVKLSLGYDVAIAKVEPMLLEAATSVGLEDPFIRILELGDFSITYQASGFLSDIKRLLSSNSELCRAVVEKLHGAGIEIVSPNFMNQRVLSEGLKFIAQPELVTTETQAENTPEELMFDKAEEAEQQEVAIENLKLEIEQMATRAQEADGEARKQIQAQLEIRKQQLEELMNHEPAGHDDTSKTA